MHKYPRICLFLLCFILAYMLFHVGAFDWLHRVRGYGYVSVFIAGLLFSFGFTTPFAIAIFAEMASQVNPFLAAPVAGIGAVLSDLFIFDLVRFSVFHDEIMRLRNSKMILKLHALVHHESVPEKLRHWLLWSFAGIIIASPLPDELGISLVSGISQLQPKQFGVMCFVFNTMGVLLIMLASRALG